MSCQVPRFGFTVLGSGSGGNATVIHAGFSAKQLKSRMMLRGIEPENIRAILLTHGHIDHTSGCRVFADQYKIPTYLTEAACSIIYLCLNS